MKHNYVILQKTSFYFLTSIIVSVSLVFFANLWFYFQCPEACQDLKPSNPWGKWRWTYEKDETTKLIAPSNLTGFKFLSIPTKVAYFSKKKGWLCSHVVQGNNYGFVDKDDFFPQKKMKRVIVFGDSHSSALICGKPWPQVAQELLSKYQIEIYNFSVDGGGLVHWWAAIKNILIPQKFEADLIIFALAEDDLIRPFSWILENRGRLINAKQKEYSKNINYNDNKIKDNIVSGNCTRCLALKPGSIGREKLSLSKDHSFVEKTIIGAQDIWKELRQLKHLLFKREYLNFPPEYMFKSIKEYSTMTEAPIYIIDLGARKGHASTFKNKLGKAKIFSSPKINVHKLLQVPSYGLPDDHLNNKGSRDIGKAISDKILEWLQID